MGYIQSAGGNVEQPASALTAVYICIGVIPVTAMVLSCIFLWNYDLSETRLKTQQVVTS
jgi:Na+/melibiose symporter-like transporter